MANRLTSLTRILAITLAAPTVFAASASGAQTGGWPWGPYHPIEVQGPRHPGRVWADGYCGARDATRAPDIMTYDRATHSEVLVDQGPNRPSQVTGINRETGSAYSVNGDFNGPRSPTICSANAVTGSALTVASDGEHTDVRGRDGVNGRVFDLTETPEGSRFAIKDLRSGRAALAETGPDGRATFREFGPHALACTRLRLGGGVHAGIDDVVGVGAKGGVGLSLGDC